MLPTESPLTRACQTLTNTGYLGAASGAESEARTKWRQRVGLLGADHLAVTPDREEAAVTPERFVIVRGERARLHLGHGGGEIVDVLDRVADLLAHLFHVCAIIEPRGIGRNFVERAQHEPRAVVRLGGRDRPEIAAIGRIFLVHPRMELLR